MRFWASGHWRPLVWQTTTDVSEVSAQSAVGLLEDGTSESRSEDGTSESRSKVKIKVKVTLRPTVSQPVRLGVRRPSGIRDQFLFILEIFFRLIRVCYFVTPSLTRGQVCNLLLLLVLASAVPRYSRPYLTVPILETPPTWRTRTPYFYPPGTGWPRYTPVHWVPFPSPLTTRMATVEAFYFASNLESHVPEQSDLHIQPLSEVRAPTHPHVSRVPTASSDTSSHPGAVLGLLVSTSNSEVVRSILRHP
jgi:hypothetical protein